MKMQYLKYRKTQFCIQLNIDIYGNYSIIKLIHIDLKPKILIASVKWVKCVQFPLTFTEWN